VFKKVYSAMKFVVLFPNITSRFEWRRGSERSFGKHGIYVLFWLISVDLALRAE